MEENIRECKLCKQKKDRILSGKYPDERNNRWVDNTDRLWNGRVCPDCHADRSKDNMKKKRSI